MKPTCLIAGMFNYDTIVSKEGRKGPAQIVAQEDGGTGGVMRAQQVAPPALPQRAGRPLSQWAARSASVLESK